MTVLPANNKISSIDPPRTVYAAAGFLYGGLRRDRTAAAKIISQSCTHCRNIRAIVYYGQAAQIDDETSDTEKEILEITEKE